MKKIAIIGYGRFGELLCELLAPRFELAVVENDEARRTLVQNKAIKLIELEDLPGYDTVFFAVPISAFENVAASAAQFIASDQLVMDICSVKVHPANMMQKHLSHAKLVATHPYQNPVYRNGEPTTNK